MSSGYFQYMCSVCHAFTWHYRPQIGKAHCCVHGSNLIKGNAVGAPEAWIAQPEKQDLASQPPAEPVTASQSAKVPNKGFYRHDCDLCQRSTIWYKGQGSNETAHCTEHSPWQAELKNGVVVNRKHAIGSTAMLMELVPQRENPTEEQVRRMNVLDRSKYKGMKNPDSVRVDDPDFAAALFDGIPTAKINPANPEAVYCSFCGDPTSFYTRSSEVRPEIRKYEDLVTHTDGTVEIVETVKVIPHTYHACPKCCNRIEHPTFIRTV